MQAPARLGCSALRAAPVAGKARSSLDAPPFGLRPSQAKPAPPWMLRPSGYARRRQSLLLLGYSALRAAPVAGKARSSFSRARSRVTFTPEPDRGWDGAGGSYRCRASTGARDEAVRTFGVAGAVADPLRDHHFRPSSRPRPNRRSDRIRHLQAVLSHREHGAPHRADGDDAVAVLLPAPRQIRCRLVRGAELRGAVRHRPVRRRRAVLRRAAPRPLPRISRPPRGARIARPLFGRGALPRP